MDGLLVTRDGGVATVELHRPAKRNAIDLAMWSRFASLMPELDADDTVDVVVLRGPAGGPFSAGADISEFSTQRSTPESAARYGEVLEAGEAAIRDLRTPSIAMVEGFAIGGGSQVALACDLRLCEHGSRFGITPAKLDIVYGIASTARLVEVVGSAWARWILLTGELLDAETALRIGLVHEVVPREALEARTAQVAGTLASRARVSLRGGKALIDRVAAGGREEDEQVREHYDHSLHSAEYAEGVAAFLAKRPPDFRAARTRPTAAPGT